MIAYLNAVNIGYINHNLIHADLARYRGFFALYQNKSLV